MPVASSVVKRFVESSGVAALTRREFQSAARRLETLYEQQKHAITYDPSVDDEIALLEADVDRLMNEHRAAVLPSRDEVLAELARRELSRRKARSDIVEFAQYLNPLYVVNWHHRRLGDALMRWYRGEIKRLVVCMPPRHGKTELVSRLLPAFIHGNKPTAEIIFATHTGKFATDVSLDVQAYLDSPQYQTVFPNTKLYSPNARAMAGGRVVLRRNDEYRVVGHKGRYLASGIYGGIIGRGFDYGILDDPIKGWQDARSPAKRAALVEWFEREFFSRRSHNASILVTVTRWHEADLVGYLLDKQATGQGEKWELLVLPAIKVDDADPDDPRQVGEALWPDRFDLDFLKPAQATPSTWASMYQQQPSPDTGTVFERPWFAHRWKTLPADFDEIVISVDCTFAKTRDGSFVCMQVWGRKGPATFYLLDEVRDRMSYVETKQALRDLSAKWPEARRKLVEKAANGYAIINEFGRGPVGERVAGVVGVPTRGESKEARAEAVTPYFAAGNVILPDVGAKTRGDKACHWIGDWIEEHVAFPSAKRNDRVDATSQALSYLAESGSKRVTFGRA